MDEMILRFGSHALKPHSSSRLKPLRSALHQLEIVSAGNRGHESIRIVVIGYYARLTSCRACLSDAVPPDYSPCSHSAAKP